MNQLEIFSKNLQFYMTARNKKQADLSRFLHVSSATVSDWCNGKKMPQTKRIGDIASWLNIQVTDLFDESDQNEEKLTIIADSELARFIEAYRSADPALRNAALAVLISGARPSEIQGTPKDKVQ